MSPSDDLEEEIIVQRGAKTPNDKIVEVHDDTTMDNIDVDEDGQVNTNKNKSNVIDEEHQDNKTENEILNEKNTHIVHHLAQPQDKRVVNVNLDLLQDQNGTFYVAGKDGVKGSAFDGNFDVLETQLDQVRNKELQKVNNKQNGATIQEASEESDQSSNVLIKTGNLDELPEVQSQDMNVDLNQSPANSRSEQTDLTQVQLEGNKITNEPTEIIDLGTEKSNEEDNLNPVNKETASKIDSDGSTIQVDSAETVDKVDPKNLPSDFKPSLQDTDEDVSSTPNNVPLENMNSSQDNSLNKPTGEVDIENPSSPDDIKVNRRNRKLESNPFKNDTPKIMYLARNFLNPDEDPRSLEEIAEKYDMKEVEPEPRELFNDLDMEARLAPQLGIKNFYQDEDGFVPQLVE